LKVACGSYSFAKSSRNFAVSSDEAEYLQLTPCFLS